MAAFVAHLERAGRLSPRTIQAYRADLVQFARFLHASLRGDAPSISRIDPPAVVGFAAELRDRGQAPATVRRKVAAVRALCGYLVDLGILDHNPARGPGVASAPCGEAAPVRSDGLSLAQIQAALDLLPGTGFADSRDRAILEVLYGSGLRLEELVALNLSALDLEDATLRVTSPRGASRSVPLGPQAAAALGRYLLRRAESLIDRPMAQLEAGALFVGARGRRLHRRAVQRAVRRHLDEAGEALARQGVAVAVAGEGVQGPGPRALRQAFASHLLEAGADAAAVQVLLGQEAMPKPASAPRDLESLRQRYARAHPRA
ncbi:MAG: tyrosine-type recombinase/integrase [Gemmatimonadota bacterium]